MLGRSWRLWVGSGTVPRVPFAASLPDLPRGISWGIFGALMVAIVLTFVIDYRSLIPGDRSKSSDERGPRGILGLAPVLLAWLVLGDQHRFQPWAYQFMMAGLALATTDAAEAVRLNRLFLAGLYVHSGLSKLDGAFVQGNGRVFLGTALSLVGLEPGRGLTGLAYLMPIGEIAVGLGLCWRPTRPWALAGAIAMHGALLGILGPRGLGQSFNVLVWNAALIVEVWCLFGPGPEGMTAGVSNPLAGLTRLVFVLAVTLPFGERWGWFDAWPSFALYAGHTERVEVEILGVGDSFEPRRIDLTAWSLADRGTPVYPQARACLGLAEALARRYPAVRVRVVGRSDFWTGRRRSVEALGLGPIRELASRFWLNAHPAGPWADGMRVAKRWAR